MARAHGMSIENKLNRIIGEWMIYGECMSANVGGKLDFGDDRLVMNRAEGGIVFCIGNWQHKNDFEVHF